MTLASLSIKYIWFAEIIGVWDPDISIFQFLLPLIILFDIKRPLLLREKILLPEITGFAVMSLKSKFEIIDIFDVFSDHTGWPSSYLKAIISPLLNGAITIFSIATGEAVNKFFLDSSIVWNDHRISPVLNDNEKILLSAEMKKTWSLYISGADSIGKSICVSQFILELLMLIDFIWPYASTKIIVLSK